MKTNHFNHIYYEKLVAALKEESQDKDVTIRLLRRRIYELTAKPNPDPPAAGYTRVNPVPLLESINYN